MLRRAAMFSLIVFFIFMCSAPGAFGQGSSSATVPQLLLDDGSGQTPIAKGLTKHTQDLRNDVRSNPSNPHYNPSCQDPTSADAWDHGNPDTRNPNKNGKLQKAKNCKVAALDVVSAPTADCADCGISDHKDSNGNKDGKQMKNVVTVYYDSPSERADNKGGVAHDKNNNLIQPPLTLGAKRKKSQSIETPTNFTDPNSPDPMNTTAFAPDPLNLQNAPPKPNVSHFTDNLGSNNNPLFGSNCTGIGGTIVPQPTALPIPLCDLNKAVVARANNAWANRPNPQPNDPQNMFDVDSDGNPTDSSITPTNGAVNWGQEGRQQTITETYSIHCPSGYTYVEPIDPTTDSSTTSQNVAVGECVKAAPAAAAGAVPLAVPMAAANVQPLSALTGGITTASKYAMMGFTFAPPVVSWSWSTDESACVFGLCVTVFSADIGYDFDVAAGLRLPVQLGFPDVPLAPLATNIATLNPTLTPVNFMQQDYKNFCNDGVQNPGMVDGFIISSCDRFSFPEYFSSSLASSTCGANAGTPACSVPIDGKELVAQAIIGAHADVTVMDVNIININLNAGSDYSTDLTALNIISHGPSELVDALHSGSWSPALLEELNSGYNLSSFTPPFTTDPSQFLTGTFHFDADCDKAQYVDHLYLTSDSPICTGLEVDYDGATLGIGLTVTLGAGSNEINTSWSVTGDAIANASSTAEFQPGSNAPIGPITFDNYDPSTDSATVQLNNFTFCVNEFHVELDADLEFGGILSPIPSLPSFPIFTMNYNPSGCGIPIGQHNGTGPINFSIPVTNYALSISGTPAILPIKPGKFGGFNIASRNLGTALDNVTNFKAVTPDYSGNQWSLPTGWTSSFSPSSITGVSGHSSSSGSVTLSVNPLKHPLTAPGTYPVNLTADSSNAESNSLPATDPLGNYRLGAPATVNVTVLPFSDPRLSVTPTSSSGKPGAASQSYAVQGQNYGNAEDTFTLNLAFVDFNTAGCTLTTLGSTTGCPYRAFPTVIQSTAWTTASGFPQQFAGLYPFGSSGSPQTASGTLSIGAPSTWAGMQDTTYTWTLTGTSTNGADTPPGSAIISVPQTVKATKQSMTRYIGLEISDFIAQVQAADAAGYNTAGILPLLMHPIQNENNDAVADILAGDFTDASKDLATEINQVQAIQNMMKNMNVPTSTLADWRARCLALINDMALAQASNITS